MRLNVQRKVEEAHYFLRMLHHLQSKGSIMGDPVEAEATFVTSALMNACYSIIDQLERNVTRNLRESNPPSREPMIQEIKEWQNKQIKENEDLYTTRGSRGNQTHGLRHLTVHHGVVEVEAEQETIGGSFGAGPPGASTFGGSRPITTLYVLNPINEGRIPIYARLEGHVTQLADSVDLWQQRIAGLQMK